MPTPMGITGPARTSVPLAILAIGAIVLGAAAAGYLVTTFLFAFSGGQNRMAGVVHVGGLIVVGLDVLLGAAGWILRSPADALSWTALAAGAGWAAALIADGGPWFSPGGPLM